MPLVRRSLTLVALVALAACEPPPECSPCPEPECPTCKEVPAEETKRVQKSAGTPIEPGPDGVVKLPAPDMVTGTSLMEALGKRRTTRTYSPERLDAETLGTLLWAASGVNRPETGKRTAPTAVNFQEILVYVALEQGLFLYGPSEHALRLVLAEDLREDTGLQDFVGSAPVELVYVADHSRMSNMDEEEKAFYTATDTGYVSQNVYLFCASRGLATVVRGMLDRETLAGTMGLPPEQHVVLAQSVGWPAAR